MKSLLILSVLMLSACGNNNPNLSPASAEPSILSKWTALPGNAQVIVPNPDLTGLTLNVMLPIEDFVVCTGSYGNNVVTLGVPSGQMEVHGSAQIGYIQMGNTMYYGMTGDLGTECSNLSKETYIYTISGGVLNLCLENLSYPFCTTYSVSQ